MSTAPDTAAPARKFSATRVTTAPDKSAGKNIITGASGKGKTYFVSTITSDDGRPVFMLPVEEGLKGASPNHAPAKFSDGQGNPILPANFAELMQALFVFRTELNVQRPPANWLAGLGYVEGDPALEVLRALVDVFPASLPLPVLATRAGIATSIVDKVFDGLLKTERARKAPDSGNVLARPDKSWRRPHVHFGVDSLSGVETLIHREITKRNDVASMADKEYNALYSKALPLWQEFRDELDRIRWTGVHVWLVAHSVEDVDAGSSGDIYRALDLMFRGSGKSLTEIRQFWRQWADSIFYLVNDVEVQKGGKDRRTTARIRGRRLITTETAQCRAKSRYALPPALPASWPDLVAAMKAGAPATPDKLRARILALVPRLDADAQGPISADVEAAFADKSAGRLAAILSRVEGLVLCAEEARAEAAGASAAPEGTDDTSTEPGAAMPPPGASAAAPPATPTPAAPEAGDDEGAEIPPGM